MGAASSFEVPKAKYASLLPYHFRTQIKSSESSHGYVWNAQKIIGSGEYSTVYGGKQRSDNTLVAVKKIKSQNLSNERKQRIINEIKILQSISKLSDSKNHFVSLLDAFSDQDGNIYIVTKYISGCELLEIISSPKKSNTALKEYFVRKMLLQIFKAVSILHQNDIAHRDIKLENIMYDKDKKDLKLIDFGFAMKTSTTNENGETKQILSNTFCGSLHYVSPEVVLQKPHDPKKVDIWSLGVLAYVLFTGKLPFSDPCQKAVLQQIISTQYHEPSHLSKQGKNFLSLLLDPNPDTRPSITSLLTHPWWSCPL